MPKEPREIPDLWPDDFGEADVVPPVTILRAQAAALAKRTKGLVEGRVSSQAEHQYFLHPLALVAPALGDYSYSLLVLRHEIDLYPCSVSASWEPSWTETKDEDTLYSTLASVFSNPAAIRVIRALAAQSKAGER